MVLFHEQQRETLSGKREVLDNIKKFIDDFDIDVYNDRQENIENLTEILDQINTDLNTLQREQKNIESKSCLLKEVPCGPEFSHCKFIKDAYEALDKKDTIHEQVETFLSRKEKTETIIEEINPQQVREYIEKYDQLLAKRSEVEKQISSTEHQIEKRKSTIAELEDRIQSY